jgi:two-component system response regulator HydG
VRNEWLLSLAAPLIAFGHLRGALYLEGNLQSSRFEEEHLGFLEALADTAALAMWMSERFERFESVDNELDLRKAASLPEIIGESDATQRVKKQMQKAAADDSASVLITGETGTGKEAVARGIHRMSARRAKPLVTFNCGNAQDPSFAQSELFGHVKGAFTGAIEARNGKLLKAQGGTIFFDEIGDLPPAIQAMLLHVLQERELEHVGADETIKIDVRVISATNVDLEEAVRNNTFRKDLLYRLNVVTIAVPPLRERRGDIPLLAQHFLRMYGAHRPNMSIASEVMEAFTSYDWPGNIRQLQGAIHSAIVDAELDVITIENIPKEVREARSAQANSPISLNEVARRAAEEARVKEIKASLAKNGNNVDETAREFGVTKQYIYRLLRYNK